MNTGSTLRSHPWHDRFSNNSKLNHDVLLVGFFPAGYSYYNQFWPKNLIKLQSAAKLGSLFGSIDDVKSRERVSGLGCLESGDILFLMAMVFL